jgi:3-oxoacyl-[acyl-carrier protein] reductase
MEVRLDGKSAIVTGGSKGLGLAIAKEFAASGADVAILARDAAALADAKGEIQQVAKGKVSAISCDVSKAAAIEAACKQVNSEFGKVDIFVNNAGQSTRGPSETITDEQWQADLDLKLFAQIRFCRILMPQMKQRKWGRIISVLNIGAKAPGADSAPTSVSRAAQMALTKAMSSSVTRLSAATIANGPMSASTSLSRRPGRPYRWAAWARPRNSRRSRRSSPRSRRAT